ncbi:CHY zinc finger protein [Fructobacillus evanidus]
MTKRFFGAKQVAMVGIDIGTTGTCVHYHSDVDIAGLRCAQCEEYFACYQCHDTLRDHHFVPMAKDATNPAVLCGRCGQELTYQEYKTGACLNCLAPFNPRCEIHEERYFC